MKVILKDGYFIHFYVSDDLPPLQKHVVFALDTSGSMSGRRIEQLKEAMISILDQIMPQDLISILDFNYVINVHDVETRKKVVVDFEDNENYLEIMHKFEVSIL